MTAKNRKQQHIRRTSRQSKGGARPEDVSATVKRTMKDYRKTLRKLA